MARVCDICGKGPQFGNNISHANNVTKRRWNVNLRPVKAMVKPDRKRVEDVLHVADAARSINQILDLDQVMDQIVNHLAVSFGCEESSILLRDEDELVVAAVQGCLVVLKGGRFGHRGLTGDVAST